MERKKKPISPGEAFQILVIDGLRVSVSDVAKLMKFNKTALGRVIGGSRLGVKDAIKFAKLTGTTPQYWSAMQMNLDIWYAENLNVASEVEFFKEIGELNVD